MRAALTTVLAVVALAALAWLAFRDDTPTAPSTSIGQALDTDTTGYARALAPRPLVFPEDHGPHPDFKLEWWYLTGNLAGPDGERYGYQFTIFRNAVAPPPTRLASIDDRDDGSGWTTRQLYLGHFAVTDARGERFYAFERFSRGAAGLAGAQGEPFRVWLDDWTLEAETPGGAIPPMRLRAGAAPGDENKGDGEPGRAALDLMLRAASPLVLQGDGGFSPKGPGVGNASFYYSFTRLHADGTLTLTGEGGAAREVPVTGTSWMDREWSTSLLGATQTGWDWFSLHLDDGRDLMLFRVRESDPAATPHGDGLLIDGATTTPVDPATARFEPLATWTSPRTGAAYPTAWRITLAEQNLDLRLDALLEAQELDASVAYWEGAVRVTDAETGAALGRGYVELTGYGDNEALAR